jgi:hypothetical protein
MALERVPPTRLLQTTFRLSLTKAAALRDDLLRALKEGNAAIEDALRAASRLIDGHGVEVVNDPGGHQRGYWWWAKLVYVNMGATYSTTLAYDVEREAFRVIAWGDWLEKYEQDVGHEVA